MSPGEYIIYWDGTNNPIRLARFLMNSISDLAYIVFDGSTDPTRVANRQIFPLDVNQLPPIALEGMKVLVETMDKNIDAYQKSIEATYVKIEETRQKRDLLTKAYTINHPEEEGE